jgi:DNA-directed RNA polymerase specialized sigma24 family protein
MPGPGWRQAAQLVPQPEQEGRLSLADSQAATSQLTRLRLEMLVLVAIENFGCDKASVLMNCRVDAVKNRVWRARMKS